MRKTKKIGFTDIIVSILAMIILIFVIAMIVRIDHHIGQGLFKAIAMAWEDCADWVLENVFGVHIGYKADVEFPIVNANISITSYWR